MIEEVRALPADRAFAGVAEFRVGAAAALRPLPAWKAAADFLFAQVSFSVDALMRWRDANPVEIPVYAGVMVLASEAHAQRMASVIPDIDIPAGSVRNGSGQIASRVSKQPAIRSSSSATRAHSTECTWFRSADTEEEPPGL